MSQRIENAIFFENITELLATGTDVKIRIRGTSMRPFLKEGRDCVILRKISDENDLDIGQIVLAKFNGSYVLHRIYSREGDTIQLMGDANIRYKETVKRNDILAYVTALERNGRRMNPNRSAYKFKVKLWMCSLPLRKPIMLLLSSVKRSVTG